jgi:hypothetical protein
MSGRKTELNSEKKTRRAKEARQPSASWRGHSICRARDWSLDTLRWSRAEHVRSKLISRNSGELLDVKNAFRWHHLPLKDRLWR